MVQQVSVASRQSSAGVGSAKGGIRLLKAAGFVEQGDQLVLAPDAPVDPACDAIARLQEQAAQRTASESDAKTAELLRRKEDAEKENEEAAEKKKEDKKQSNLMSMKQVKAFSIKIM